MDIDKFFSDLQILNDDFLRRNKLKEIQLETFQKVKQKPHRPKNENKPHNPKP